MYLRQWKTVVESRSGQLMGLTLEASVRCPNADCKREATIQSDNEVLLPISRALARIMRGKVNELIAQRACVHCGIMSAMPRRDSNRLLTEVMRDITVAWVGEQITPSVASEKPDSGGKRGEDRERKEPVPSGA